MLPMNPSVVLTPSGPASWLIVSYSEVGSKIAPASSFSCGDHRGSAVIIGIWSTKISFARRSWPQSCQ
jgi:hypothetical protein